MNVLTTFVPFLSVLECLLIHENIFLNTKNLRNFMLLQWNVAKSSLCMFLPFAGDFYLCTKQYFPRESWISSACPTLERNNTLQTIGFHMRTMTVFGNFKSVWFWTKLQISGQCRCLRRKSNCLSKFEVLAFIWYFYHFLPCLQCPQIRY